VTSLIEVKSLGIEGRVSRDRSRRPIRIDLLMEPTQQEALVRRFLLSLAVSGLTVTAIDSALARGGPLHLFKSQLPSVSRAGVPAPSLRVSPSDLLGGCGRGRYRDAATQRCQGPADFGN
jgi:hypothetical protein